MPSRRCFALDLVNDAGLIAEYRRMHQPNAVWPRVVEHIRRQGILDMQIWQRGERLFMIMETTDDYPRTVNEPSLLDAHDRWEALMGSFQRRLAEVPDSEKWASMECIFELSRQHGQADP